jgi:NAD(P)-dependent dehydrogenase (short-subunit alcohol dehydrogenase family)
MGLLFVLVAAVAVLLGALRAAFVRIPHKELDWDGVFLPMARQAGFRQDGGDEDGDERLPLEGVRAVVTGATNGIGLALTRALVQKLGASVVAVGRSEAKLEKLRGELGASVTTVRADLADLDSVARAADEIAQSFDSIDILINNAGIAYPDWFTFNFSNKQGFDRLFVTNYLSHVLLTDKLLPKLHNSTAKRPTVLQVTSSYHIEADGSDLVPLPGREGQRHVTASRPGGAHALLYFRGKRAYANSKLGQLYHARSLQKRHPKLRVVSICPSWVGTDIGGGEGVPRREVMMRLGYLVDGWGISSALYGLFSKEEEGDFFSNTGYYEFFKSVMSGMPGWASTIGLRDAITNVVAISGLVGQHFFSRVGPTRASLESYDMEKAEALWEWSYRAISPYVSTSSS